MLNKLTPEYLAELRNSYSNMNLVETKSEEVITLTFKKSKLKLKPSNISYYNLFGNPQNEEHNIAFSLLEVLDSIPHQMLDAICGNIVLAGGLWRVKGMQNYFKKQIKTNLEHFPRLIKFDIAQKMSIFVLNFRIRYMGL